jgi:heme O synthase-like polyprenyltransferase
MHAMQKEDYYVLTQPMLAVFKTAETAQTFILHFISILTPFHLVSTKSYMWQNPHYSWRLDYLRVQKPHQELR